jgi:hypothetical protein
VPLDTSARHVYSEPSSSVLFGAMSRKIMKLVGPWISGFARRTGLQPMQPMYHFEGSASGTAIKERIQ